MKYFLAFVFIITIGYLSGVDRHVKPVVYKNLPAKTIDSALICKYFLYHDSSIESLVSMCRVGANGDRDSAYYYRRMHDVYVSKADIYWKLASAPVK